MSEIKDAIRQMVLDKLASLNENMTPGSLPNPGLVTDTTGRTSTILYNGQSFDARTPFDVSRGQEVAILVDDQMQFTAIPYQKAPDTVPFLEPEFFTGGFPARIYVKSSAFTTDAGNIEIVFQDMGDGREFHFDSGLSAADWSFLSAGRFCNGIASTPDGYQVVVSFLSTSLDQYKIRLYRVGKVPRVTATIDANTKNYTVTADLVKDYTKTPTVVQTHVGSRKNLEVWIASVNTVQTSEEDITEVYTPIDIQCGPPDANGNFKIYILEDHHSAAQCNNPPPPISPSNHFQIWEDTWIQYHLYEWNSDPTDHSVPTKTADFLVAYWTNSGIGSSIIRQVMVKNIGINLCAYIWDGAKKQLVAMTHPNMNFDLYITEIVNAANSFVSIFTNTNGIAFIPEDGCSNPVCGERLHQGAHTYFFKETTISTLLGKWTKSKDFMATPYKFNSGGTQKILIDDGTTIQALTVSDPNIPNTIALAAVVSSPLSASMQKSFYVDVDQPNNFTNGFRKIKSGIGGTITISADYEKVSPGIPAWDGIRYHQYDPQIIQSFLGVATDVAYTLLK